MSPATDGPASRIASIFPVSVWLRNYRVFWLRNDLFAGMTLAAYAIPVSMAYASLAGLPPQYGIYCYLTAGIAYALVGSSRQLAVGPTSAIAMLVGTTVASMSGGDATRAASIAALTALVVAILAVVAWLLRLSGLVSFISGTILTGFKAGAALTIALTQLPKLFGVPGGGENFFDRAWTLIRQLHETNLVVLALGSIAIVVLLFAEHHWSGRPVAILVVVASILAVTFANLTQLGVTVVGALPRGLPHFEWPRLQLRDVEGILPLAAACFLLGYVESISAACTLAAKNGYEVDPRQELLALGAANLAAATSHGFPIAGGLSQSAVNDQAGAQSPLALVFSSVTIGFCLSYLTGLLYNLPNVILASIVIVAVRGLIDISALRRLWRVSKFEFAVALVALAGVLLLGILKGVLLAVIVSILSLLSSVAHPHVAFLGRIPGTRRYSDLDRHPDNERTPGVLIFRVEASLVYFNVDHVRHILWQKISLAEGLRLVVCDLSTSPYVDDAGAGMLIALNKRLKADGISLRIVEAHARVRDLLRAEGLENQVGYLGRQMSIEQAIMESAGR